MVLHLQCAGSTHRTVKMLGGKNLTQNQEKKTASRNRLKNNKDNGIVRQGC